MKISVRLQDSIYRNILPFRAILASTRSYEVNNSHINKMFLKVPVDNYRVEIPLFVGREILDKLNVDDIIIPISSRMFTNFKTTDSMIVSMLAAHPRKDNELYKIVSEKYGTYYGVKGLIMNENFEVLLMSVLECTFNNNIPVFNSIKLYVNPKVSMSDSGIEKIIYTKIIPLCLNRIIFNEIPRELIQNVPIDTKINVVFEDVTDRFFIKTIPPKGEEDIDQVINEILENNIDTIVDSLTHVNR